MQIPELHLIHYRSMVELGGGLFIGCMDAGMSAGIEPLVLFNSPKTRSTLALRVSKVSAEEVRRSIRLSDEQFEKAFEEFSEKACRRVFEQFSRKETLCLTPTT